MMLDSLIVELMAKGMLMVAALLFDDSYQAAKETRIQLERMTGILNKLQLECSEQLSDLEDKLDAVYRSILESELSQVRNQILQAMSDEVEDSTVRGRIVEIALLLYCLVRKTAVQQVAIKTEKMVCLSASSSSSQDSRRFMMESETVVVESVTTVREIVSKLLELNEIGIFSEITHSSDEQMRITVHASPREGARRDDLIIATGGLFKLCQSLCNVVQDSRGVYAVAKGDAFSKSPRDPQKNACLIALYYLWPTPLEFKEHEDFVVKASKALKGDPDVEQESFDEFTEAFEKKKYELDIRNVYLLGLTGGGKSTLGNRLTGTDRFHVSNAGTGTDKISGGISEGGLLGAESNVMVWDTPGMDDQQGRDRIYESMLYQHLTRENTVSTIIIVSKDGSRFPKSLKRTISVYQRAFGDAFLSCVCVCIGLNEDNEDQIVLNERRTFWENNLIRTFKFSEEAVRKRVFFYDARHQASNQKAAQKLKNFILSGKPHLTGTGVAILRGLQRLRSAQLQDEEKRNMVQVSEELFKALRAELDGFQRVRMRFPRDSQYLTEKLVLKLLPNVEERIKNFFRKKEKDEVELDKVIEIVPIGKRAKQLLTFDYLSHQEMGCHMKMKILAGYVKTWDLILVNMNSKPVGTGRRRIQLQTYNLMHLDDNLDKAVFDAVDKLLNEMAIDPKFVVALNPDRNED
eukprot:TRINITY_DN751_c0_g1_i1.p1 TRINITY_DN751_c0_g1~~TRINITY_DN751_c0_g1_i1.p1  ORF type:complete len:690 (-),score=96.47 TRINITY_DN751_c0_g1_i1:241-2310(-)